MIVLKASNQAQTFHIIANISSDMLPLSDVAFQFTSPGGTIINADGALAKDGFRQLATVTVDLGNEQDYDLEVLHEGTLIYKDTVFVTNQDIDTYSINDGQYTYFDADTDTALTPFVDSDSVVGVAEDFLQYPQEGGDMTIQVTAAGPFTVSTDAGWLSFVSSGSGTTNVTITATENEDVFRTAVLNISADGVTRNVRVDQLENPIPEYIRNAPDNIGTQGQVLKVQGTELIFEDSPIQGAQGRFNVEVYLGVVDGGTVPTIAPEGTLATADNTVTITTANWTQDFETADVEAGDDGMIYQAHALVDPSGFGDLTTITLNFSTPYEIGLQGPTGPQGPGYNQATLNPDYTLTLTPTGGAEPFTSTSIRGEQGERGLQGLQGPGRFTVYQTEDSSTPPDSPLPTEYNINSDFGAANGLPTGWTVTPDSPGVGESTFAITTLYDAIDAVDSVISLTWSVVFVAGATGPSGPAGVSIVDANVPDSGPNEGHLVLTRDQGLPVIVTDGVVAGVKNFSGSVAGGTVTLQWEEGDGTHGEYSFSAAGLQTGEAITLYNTNTLYRQGNLVANVVDETLSIYRWNDAIAASNIALNDPRWDSVLRAGTGENAIINNPTTNQRITQPSGTVLDITGSFDLNANSGSKAFDFSGTSGDIHLEHNSEIYTLVDKDQKKIYYDTTNTEDSFPTTGRAGKEIVIKDDLTLLADEITALEIQRNEDGQTLEDWEAAGNAAGDFVADESESLTEISLANNLKLLANDSYSKMIVATENGDNYHFDLLRFEARGGRLVLQTDNLVQALTHRVEIVALLPDSPEDVLEGHTINVIYLDSHAASGLYRWDADLDTPAWVLVSGGGVTLSNLGEGTTQDPLKIPGMVVYDQVNDRYYIENNGNAFGRFVSFNAYEVGDRVLHDQVLYECIEPVAASATGANLNPSTDIFLSTQRPGSTQAGQTSTTHWRYIAGPTQKFNAGDSYLKGSEIDYEYLGSKHIYTTLFSLNGTDTTGDANNPERRSYRLPGDSNADNVWYEHLLGGLDGVGDHQTREFPATHPGSGFFIPVGSFWNWMGQTWEFNGPDPEGTSHPTGTLYAVADYNGNSTQTDPKTGALAKHFPPNLYSGLWTRSHDESLWGPFNAYTQGEQVTYNTGTKDAPVYTAYRLVGADKAFIDSSTPNKPPNHADEAANWIEVTGGSSFNPTEYDPTQVYQTGALVTADGELFQCTATTTAQPGNSTIETEGDNWRSITETLASVDSVATFALLNPDNSIIRVGEIMCVINDPSPYNNGLYRVISHNAGGTSVARIDELNHLHEIVEGIIQHSGSSASFEFPDDNPAFITGTLVDESKFTTVEGTKSTSIPSLDTVGPKFEPGNGRMTLIYNNLSDTQITQLEAAVGSDLAFRTTAGGVVTAGNVEDTDNAVAAQSTYHFLLKSVNYRLGTGRRQLNFVMRDLSQATDFVSAFTFLQNTGVTGNAGNLYIPTDGPLVTNLIDNISLVNIVAISGGGGTSLTTSEQATLTGLNGISDNAFAQRSGTGYTGGSVITGVALGSHIGEITVTTNNDGTTSTANIGVDHIVFSDDTTDWDGTGIPDNSFGMDGQLALSNFASAAYIKRNGIWSAYIFPSSEVATTFGSLRTVIDLALTGNSSQTVIEPNTTNQSMAIRGNGTGSVILEGASTINDVDVYKMQIPTILLGTRGVATAPATISGVDDVTIQSFTRGTSVNYLFTGIVVVDESASPLTYEAGRALVADTDDLSTATQIANLIG